MQRALVLERRGKGVQDRDGAVQEPSHGLAAVTARVVVQREPDGLRSDLGTQVERGHRRRAVHRQTRDGQTRPLPYGVRLGGGETGGERGVPGVPGGTGVRGRLDGLGDLPLEDVEQFLGCRRKRQRDADGESAVQGPHHGFGSGCRAAVDVQAEREGGVVGPGPVLVTACQGQRPGGQGQ